MNEKKTSNEKISDALEIEVTEKSDIVKSRVKEISVNRSDVEADYDSVRKNLRELIDTGFDAVAGILKVAEEGESPRAYEVAAQMLKTVADANKDLMDMHKKVRDLEGPEGPSKVTNNQTNAIYVGSSSELLDIINPKRIENVNKKR